MDRTLEVIAAYLSCIDLDCNSKLESIRNVGSPAVPPLVALLEGKAPPALPGVTGPPDLVRVSIALGRLNDTRAVGVLERALEHPNPVLRAQALVALGSIGDRAGILVNRATFGQKVEPVVRPPGSAICWVPRSRTFRPA
jgi:HEAT repeat protein